MLAPWKESYDKPRQHIKKQRHYFADKGHLVKAMVFPVVMYGCESWPMKKAERQRINASELGSWRRLLTAPWTTRRSNQSVNLNANQSWIVIGKTDAEAPILWLPDVKSWFIWKGPDVVKDWRQEEKVITEDEIFGWHHRLNGRESGWTLGVDDGQGGLACCDSWGRKESDMPERLRTQTNTYKLNTSVVSVQFSHSVVSNSLRSHESQHARPPCPSSTPRVHPDLCPSSH